MSAIDYSRHSVRRLWDVDGLWDGASMWYNGAMAHETGTETRETYTVVVGERGRVVLPAGLRARLGLKTGDRLVFILDGSGSLRVISARELASRLAGLFADIAPGRVLSDELIAERREEARREEEL